MARTAITAWGWSTGSQYLHVEIPQLVKLLNRKPAAVEEACSGLIKVYLRMVVMSLLG